MDHVPTNSVVAQRYAARRQAELAASVAAQDAAEAKQLKPVVPVWVWVVLFIVSLLGLIKLANAFPIIYVIFGVSVAVFRYVKGYRFRDLFTTPQRKG